MPGFVKPTRKVVNIEDAFGELIGKKLIKDLHDNEEICPVCHGTGLRIEDNPYGLSDDPDKRAGQFPYKHQSIQFCPNCYNGVVRFCPDCGKQIPRYRTLCDCDAPYINGTMPTRKRCSLPCSTPAFSLSQKKRSVTV